jgi:hypothetical protein
MRTRIAVWVERRTRGEFGLARTVRRILIAAFRAGLASYIRTIVMVPASAGRRDRCRR